LHRRLPDAFDHHHALRAVRAAQRFDVAVHTATEFCKVIYLVQLT
jgi:plasmid stabilization system protein ParE